jgi:hypothetical protein
MMVSKSKEPTEENTRKRKMEVTEENDSQIVAKKKNNSKIDPETLIRVEIFRRNEKPFDGRLSRENLLEVWSQALRRKQDELEGFASVQLRGRCLRVNYRLKCAVALSSIIKRSEFEWERAVGTQLDFFSGKVLGLSNKGAKIGDVVTVCVNRTALEFSNDQIGKWLKVFGKIEGTFIYQKDKLGYVTDELEVEVKLKRHIPEFLPMYGRRIRIFYVGMQRQCNNCFGLGHFRAECEEEKKDWFSYIEDLVDSGDFEEELFGEWPEVIKRKRKEIKENKKQDEPAKNKDDKKTTKGARGGRGGSRGRGRGRGK